ncbi:unnamed protein product, partial [Clonostachys rosea]
IFGFTYPGPLLTHGSSESEDGSEDGSEDSSEDGNDDDNHNSNDDDNDNGNDNGSDNGNDNDGDNGGGNNQDNHNDPPAEGEEVVDYSSSRWDDIEVDETFHEVCLRGLRGEALREVLYRTAYSYVPFPQEFKRRLLCLKDMFAPRLELLQPLPNELKIMVVERCLPSLTTQYILSADSIEHGDFELDLTEPIWARYIKFEGHYYVSALTNRPPVTDGPGAEPKDQYMLKMEKPEGPVVGMHIALDHLGIRKVVLSGNNKVNPADYKTNPSLGGWVSLPLGGQTYVICESDGLKLRRILFDGLDQTLWRCLWPAPQSQPSNLRLWSLDECTYQTRMTYLDLNKPSTRGYSICWYYDLMAICPLNSDGDKPNYQAWDIDRPKTIWVYLPIDQGEMIVELWKAVAENATVLVFVTSHGRTLTLGVRPRPTPNHDPEWLLQDQFQGEHTLLAEESWSGVARMAFPTPQPTPQGDPPTILPPVEYPEHFQELWYSSTELTGIVSMRICRMGKVIIGLLLSYKDGRQRTLGEVRFDCLEEEIDTEGTRGIAYRLSEKRRTIRKLRTVDPEERVYNLEDEKKGRHFVPWRGTWHWWFSYTECMLSHEDLHKD